MKKYQRFVLAKRANILLILMLLLMLGVFFWTFIANQNNRAILETMTENKTQIISFIAANELILNFTIVVISIIATALLSALLIDVRAKNNLVNDVLLNDAIFSDEIFDLTSEGNRERLEKLRVIQNEKLFICNSIIDGNLQFLRNKLMGFYKEKIFYSYTSFNVECEIIGDTIMKTIVRCVKIRSFENSNVIPNLPIISHAYINGDYDPLEIEYIRIVNDKGEIVENFDLQKDISSERLESSSAVSVKNKYNCIRKCLSNKELTLNPDNDLIIEMKYITRVSIDDPLFTCRVQYPCKEFRVDFRIISDGYKLFSQAFGFADAGDKSPTPVSEEVIIEFKDWIYKNDGVAIFINSVNS